MTDRTVVAPPPGPPPAYEFTNTENKTISRAATWAKAVAVMFFINTAVQVINLNILGILVNLAIGVTFWKGANLLDAVVHTEDDDVPNMLGALEQLQTAFTIRIIITAVAAAIGLVVAVGFFVQYQFLYEPVAEEPAVTVEDAEGAAEGAEDAKPEENAAPEGGAAPPEGEAPAEGDAAPAEGEAAPAEGEAAPADGAAAPEGDAPAAPAE